MSKYLQAEIIAERCNFMNRSETVSFNTSSVFWNLAQNLFSRDLGMQLGYVKCFNYTVLLWFWRVNMYKTFYSMLKVNQLVRLCEKQITRALVSAVTTRICINKQHRYFVCTWFMVHFTNQYPSIDFWKGSKEKLKTSAKPWDGARGKGIWCQAYWPQFNAQDSRGGRKEPRQLNSLSCTHPHPPHTQTHTQREKEGGERQREKQINKINSVKCSLISQTGS